MTNNFKVLKTIRENIQDAKNTGTVLYEAKVLKVEEKSNRVLVQLLPNGDKKGLWAKMSYPLASKDTMIGSMPLVNSLVIVADLTPRDANIFSNLVVISCLFSTTNTKPVKDSANTTDKNYVTMNHSKGDKIEMFHKDNKNVTKVYGKNKLDIYADEETNIKSPKVRIGKVTDNETDNVVLKAHLEKFNSVIDKLVDLINTMNTTLYVDGILGAIPLTVMNTALSSKILTLITDLNTLKDNTNYSKITRIDK